MKAHWSLMGILTVLQYPIIMDIVEGDVITVGN